MADVKISELAAASALAGTEVVPIVQGAATVKATAADIADSGTAVATHAADTTDVHGISDTSVLATVTVTANRQTDSYTLVLGDASKVIEMNAAGANNLTVPPDSSVAFPTGTVIELFQYGAGQTTVVAGSGVTIRSSGGKLNLAAQYAAASLRKIAADEWSLAGETSA